jgi:hypothetical protein
VPHLYVVSCRIKKNASFPPPRSIIITGMRKDEGRRKEGGMTKDGRQHLERGGEERRGAERSGEERGTPHCKSRTSGLATLLAAVPDSGCREEEEH